MKRDNLKKKMKQRESVRLAVERKTFDREVPVGLLHQKFKASSARDKCRTGEANGKSSQRPASRVPDQVQLLVQVIQQHVKGGHGMRGGARMQVKWAAVNANGGIAGARLSVLAGEKRPRRYRSHRHQNNGEESTNLDSYDAALGTRLKR